MARGVAIPEVREQLFAAADRVLAREGSAGLTTRAVTAEAGVSNGVLHRHFRDLDEFLAWFLASRLKAIADGAAALPGRAGHGSVAGNLTEATVAVFGANAQALMSLIAAKPDLGPAVEHATGGLGDIERYFCDYLDAEKKLGRIGPGADTGTLAFALLGTVHHLVITHRDGASDLQQQVRRIVAALVTGMDTDAAPGTGKTGRVLTPGTPGAPAKPETPRERAAPHSSPDHSALRALTQVALRIRHVQYRACAPALSRARSHRFWHARTFPLRSQL
jgi:AcrR family transcriptional regulator